MLCLSRLSILLSEHIHTFLPITFLIFNGFSIRKKFWKAETQGFSTIPSILYVDTVDTRQGSLMHSMLCMLTQSIQMTYTFVLITFLIFNGFSICKKFWKAETQGFFNHTINTIYVNTVNTRQGSLIHSMLSMSRLLIQNTSTHSCP